MSGIQPNTRIQIARSAANLKNTESAAATTRIAAQQPVILRRFAGTLPAIYLTKLAWAWGAGAAREPGRG